ncbi:E3 ubiquitin-protein ligase ptr1 [Termitomyces sp. T112]|nr:E3 ubiquitin-protein ligase ptr1 [Termitomyces sp. T112]
MKHIVLALLPSAVEAIKRNKEKKEEEMLGGEVVEVQEKVELEDKATNLAQAEEEKLLSEAAADAEALGNTQSTSDTPVVATQITRDEAMDDAITTASTNTNADMVDAVADHVGTSADASPSRVMVLIHGSTVDITDTGIDPTFLEALPDDMREEVLSQHVRDQRAARVERPADSQIISESLDALPPEISAKIIQQEAAQRARVPNSGGPVEIDNASFLARLDPTLRQTVLMAQGETNPGTNTQPSIEAVEEKILLADPPQIPHTVLRFVVNILTIGEFSGQTFPHLERHPDLQ